MMFPYPKFRVSPTAKRYHTCDAYREFVGDFLGRFPFDYRKADLSLARGQVGPRFQCAVQVISDRNGLTNAINEDVSTDSGRCERSYFVESSYLVIRETAARFLPVKV